VRARNVAFFERELQLVGVEPLRMPAELCSLELPDELAHPLDAAEQFVALGDQRQRRRLRYAVWPEIRAGIHRLLGHIKEQASAGPLRLHDPDRCLRHALVAVEIEFEALAQNVFVDFADAPLPGRSRIGDDDVDTAERRRHGVERRAHRGRAGHIADDR